MPERPDRGGWRVLAGSGAGPGAGIIVHNVNFLAEWLVDGLLRVPIERFKRWRADRRMSSGRVDCALKVVSGSQRGLSRRWRQVVATVSPGRLDVRGHWWRLFRAIPSVSVLAVGDPIRRPSGKESWSLAARCRIVEIQTPTATLGWALLDDYLQAAVQQLRAREHGESRRTGH